MSGSSPLTRGKQESRCTPPQAKRLIPAHAGKTGFRRRSRRWLTAHPRSRGENRRARAGLPLGPGSSPLTRGKPSTRGCSLLHLGLIPAHAGKTVEGEVWVWDRRAHPRSRGENSVRLSPGLRGRGSSPLTRGKPGASLATVLYVGLIPAHAGKTSSPQPRSWKRRAHPRSRGENVIVSVLADTKRGSSPLTRGKPGRDCVDRIGLRLIPAHAGKTQSRPRRGSRMAAHPRSRGENIVTGYTDMGNGGSSPLTRGKPSSCTLRPRTARLIPAHAGKTQRRAFRGLAAPAHPRSRGENGGVPATAPVPEGSSPLTRGKQPVEDDKKLAWGLIPAHAGKTSNAAFVWSMLTAHPRSRGENCAWLGAFVRCVGSSPLTRGKRCVVGRVLPWVRLIPAHAGKTP